MKEEKRIKEGERNKIIFIVCRKITIYEGLGIFPDIILSFKIFSPKNSSEYRC